MKLRAVGKSFKRIEGSTKVSGKAVYTADVCLPGLVWGKVLRSPVPHARIVRIEASKAKQVPGVLAVLTGADLPDVLTGIQLKDIPLLARDRVRFVGERVAVVVAEDPDVAEEALMQIQVEYQELPAVFDPLLAIGDGAPLLHDSYHTYKGVPRPLPNLRNVQSHVHWSLGDVGQGFRESDYIFEHEFQTQYVHQGYLEPHAAVVAMDHAGRVQLWATTKVPYLLKQEVARVVGLDPAKILVNLVPVGGDFGGKSSILDGPLCFYLAKHTGRPVKMVMSYTEELTAGSPRHPSVITIKTGVKKDGRLVAREIKIYWNGGAYAGMKPPPLVNLPGARRAAGSYRIPHVKIDAYSVYTNCVPCGYFRAPGHPQVTFAVESQTDIIAEELGVDRLEMRLLNALRDGDPLPDDSSLTRVRCRELLQAVAEASDWYRPKSHPYFGRGLALSHRSVGIGDANAKLTLSEDGSVSLLTTYPDTGTGAHTVMCQIVAEVLGIPFERVRLEVGSTDSFRSESGIGASRVTHVLGHAAFQAASRMRVALQDQAAGMLQCAAEEIDLQGGHCCRRGHPKQMVSFSDLARGASARAQPIEVQSYMNATQVPSEGSFSAAVAEVEVDVETGQTHLLRLTTGHDVGTVLNPLAHQGQIEGGVIQGMGYALMEELIGEEGRITTASLGEYKLPNIKDIPRLKTVLVKDEVGPTPFQGKEIGESPIVPVAAAIANAVYDAIGVRIMDLPVTAEKVYGALRVKGGLVGKTQLRI